MAPVWIGLDVAKDNVVMAVAGEVASTTFEVASDGVKVLVAALQRRRPTLIVIEATGGYEQPWVTACATAALPIVVVNPRHVRAFAKALGRTAKTDAIACSRRCGRSPMRRRTRWRRSWPAASSSW
jgi:transposase